MTVKELIRHLVDFDQDLEVYVEGKNNTISIDAALTISVDEEIFPTYGKYRGVYLEIDLGG